MEVMHVIYSFKKRLSQTKSLIDLFDQGGNILETDDHKKGLLPRVVDELFEAINLCADTTTYKIKLSMVYNFNWCHMN